MNYSSVRLHDIKTYSKEKFKNHQKDILRILTIPKSLSLLNKSLYTANGNRQSQRRWDWAVPSAAFPASSGRILGSLSKSIPPCRGATATAEPTLTCLKLPQASLSEFYDTSEMKFYCLFPPNHEKPLERKEKQNPPRGTSRPVQGGGENWLLHGAAESKLQKT